MNPISIMLVTLFIGALVLMAGIWMSRDPEQSAHAALKECIAWGSGFCLTLGAQIVAIAAHS
ncbi:MAG TPA: hypothetical protein VK149_09885 [Sideroxyarcus sp.]|nr:hypothetical protein [Sideroxyarcus sp.]